MNIAIVSEFRGGYRPALEECYARAFERIGHRVTRVGTHERTTSMGGLVGRLAMGRTSSRLSKAVSLEVANTEADLVLVVKGALLRAECVRAWQAEGRKVANLFPDNPFDAMAATGAGDRLFQQLKACNRVFVHDRFAAGQLRQVGIRSSFIPFARDPELHDLQFVEASTPASPPIVFVGNPDPERIRYLRAVTDLGLGLWGAWHWAKLRKDDPLASCIQGGELLGRDMTRCLGRAQISINVLRHSQKTAHNMRTFESPACGVCTLSEASNGVLELMEEGREVVAFKTPDELRRLAIELLSDSKRRAEIAEAGWQRVRGETYDRRAQQLLEGVG